MTQPATPAPRDAKVRAFGFQRFAQHTHPAHDEAQEHVFGFKYWHFFDLGTDVVRSALKPVNAALQSVANTHPERWAPKLLPMTKLLARSLPFVGVLGEGMHVFSPFRQAKQDWQEQRIGTLKFSGLCALYAVYTITGMGGIATVGVKEGLTYLVERQGWMEKRYIPHTLYKEFKHAGILPDDAQDAHSHSSVVVPLPHVAGMHDVSASALATLSPPPLKRVGVPLNALKLM